MSHWSTLKKIDEFGINHDQKLIEWKSELETSYDLRRMMANVHEVVNIAEKEVVPPGLSTVNVAELNLSFINLHENTTCDEQPTDMVIDSCSLDIPTIRDRVKSKLMGMYDEQVFTSVMNLVETLDNKVTLEAITRAETDLDCGHPASYQIITTTTTTTIHLFVLNIYKRKR